MDEKQNEKASTKLESTTQFIQDRSAMAAIDFDYDPRVEIYKAYVESAENNIDRRHSANRFYFSIAAGVFVALSFIVQSDTNPESIKFVSSGTFFFSALNAFIWLLNILASRNLSASKYDAILEMEKYLELKPFTLEWEFHERAKRTRVKFTLVEMFIPASIAVLSLVLFVLVFFDVLVLL